LTEAATAFQEGRDSGKLMDRIRQFSSEHKVEGSLSLRTIESLCRRKLIDELKLGDDIVYMINAAGFRLLRQLAE
jgi:hypothetical protein